MKVLVYFTVLFILFSFYSYAHLDSGEDVEIDGYLIDFGYSPSVPMIGNPLILSFGLINITSDELITYESAWIRIGNEDKSLLATQIYNVNDAIVLSYTFSDPGEYEIRIRFDSNELALVQHDFLLTVSKDKKVNPSELNPTVMATVFGILIGFIISALIIKKRKN